ALCLNSSAFSTQPAQVNDDPLVELQKINEERQKTFNSINALNPMSTQYGKPGAAPQNMPAVMESLQKLLNHPATKSYLKLFSSPEFSQGTEQLVNHPNRMNLIYFQGAWLVIFLILRAWRLSRANHWAKKLWVKTWTLILFLVIGVGVVPWFVFGDAYSKTLSGFIEVLMKK
ncbi:hypothetical protein WDW86_04635, partial [Bdellovibrionota bacterium FG-2]